MTEQSQMHGEVLIVDDQPENLTVLRKMLSEYGYTVRAAINGTLALKTVADAPPDLILLDIMMPEMDGFQVCRRLKEEEQTRDIPVLFVSALSETVDKMRGFALGAVDYITKPFRSEEVLARVGAHMELKRARDTLKETLRVKEDTLVLQQAIFETIPDAIVTVDRDLNIVSANKDLQDICSENGSSGSSFKDKLQSGEGPCSQLILETLRTRKPVRDRMVTSGSSSLLLSCTPLVDAANRFFGAALVVRDVSRQSALEKGLRERQTFMGLVGKSEVVQRLYMLVEQVAATDINVLVNGPEGTEKELTAAATHAFSDRHNSPFVRIDCQATPPQLLAGELFGYKQGAFEGAVQDHDGAIQQATGGTLFFDEINALSTELQADVLRFLEHKEFTPLGGAESIGADLRVMASSSRDLGELVAQGEFLEELADRVAGVVVRVPPLTERLEDLPLLCGSFLRRFNLENQKNIKGLAPEVFQRLHGHAWPGNVEELRRIIEQAAAICPGERILPEHLPESF